MNVFLLKEGMQSYTHVMVPHGLRLTADAQE